MKIITHLIAVLGGGIVGVILGLAFHQMTKDGATLPYDVTIAVDTQEVAIIRKGTIVLHSKVIDEYWLRFSLKHTRPAFHEAQDTYYSEKEKQ